MSKMCAMSKARRQAGDGEPQVGDSWLERLWEPRRAPASRPSASRTVAQRSGPSFCERGGGLGGWVAMSPGMGAPGRPRAQAGAHDPAGLTVSASSASQAACSFSTWLASASQLGGKARPVVAGGVAGGVDEAQVAGRGRRPARGPARRQAPAPGARSSATRSRASLDLGLALGPEGLVLFVDRLAHGGDAAGE
jgi:hypothetical protein